MKKIDKMVRKSKKLDESVLMRLDEIFQELMNNNSAFSGSIKKLKRFIN